MNEKTVTVMRALWIYIYSYTVFYILQFLNKNLLHFLDVMHLPHISCVMYDIVSSNICHFFVSKTVAVPMEIAGDTNRASISADKIK